MTEGIRLDPVDRVEILSVVDNVFDLLLPSTESAKRLGLAGRDGRPLPMVEAPLLESGCASDAPLAEHGLALLVSVISGDNRRSLLFDTGSTVEGVAHNLRALGVEPGEIETIVLSHGHFDHTTGLSGLAKGFQRPPRLVVHPDFWQRRRIAIPGREPHELPTTSREKVLAAGFKIHETREPSSLLDGGLLVTGEIQRSTDFETGFPVQQAFRDGDWQPDPLIRDDQALVAHVRDKGLVVITGCGHAGIINTLRHARALTGVERVHAVVGGFHLSTPLFESRIDATIDALLEFHPQIVAPLHCTGWRATHALAAAFPDAFVPGSVGTTYVMSRG